MCVTKSPHKWVSYYYNLLQPGYFFFLFYPFTCRDMHSWLIVVSFHGGGGYTNHFVSFCSSLTLTSASSLQLTLLKSIKTVLSLLLTLTYLQRVPRSNKYVCTCRKRVLQVVVDACSLWVAPRPPPPPALSVRPSVHPFFLIHLHGWLASCPLPVTSKLLHVICTSRMYHVHPGDDF
jgi:hypothetical protein